ncbi:hypothetical protein [Psychromonas sp.]|uniref:hypothetical protein n=1 Tax=Psychromonas sp. TaxID=1884585 RepID=UPI0035661BF6
MHNLNIAFISHGGGPMPLLNDPRHAQLVAYLKSLADRLEKPSAILLISAHWEEAVATITASVKPKMIYDYDKILDTHKLWLRGYTLSSFAGFY